ncbi:hypothetical protein [Brevibacillus sp. NRS-1366]|uniref:hypothetical protein n=1 Tax=Brevibacillus sp. NRS-1366 TaxID=3233899 RepID=UPI003D22F424
MKLMLHPKTYPSKPTNPWTINDEIAQHPVDISINQLAQEIILGKTFCAGYLNTSNSNNEIKRSKECWTSQELICLDFDNEITTKDENGNTVTVKHVTRTIEEAQLQFKDKATFIYSTFNSKKDHPKFRVVMVLDRVVTNASEIDKILQSLKHQYSDADEKCFERSRLFYGGKQLYKLDYTKKISTNDLINYYDNVVKKESSNRERDYEYKINENIMGVTIRSRVLFTDYSNPHNTQQPNTTLISNKRISDLHFRLKIPPQNIKINNKDDLKEYLKKQDLRQYLGIESSTSSFHCIFHNDNKPSASIVTNEDTGHHIYICGSDKCGVKGSIIECTELLLPKYNRPKIYQFLRKVYRVEFEESQWQKDQKAILDENIDTLLDDTFPTFYPTLHKRIRDHIPDLIVFHEIAKQHITTENFIDTNGNSAFFKSMDMIASKFNKSKNKVKDKLAIFAYLDLINKLGRKDVPEFLWREAKRQQSKNRKKFLVGFYSIPSYTTHVLTSGEKQASLFKSLGYTMKGMSWEMFRRGEGEEVANKVFPQLEGKSLSDLSENLTSKIEQVTMKFISERGWARESDIISNVQHNVSEKFTGIQMKRILAELLDKYDLQRTRLNKDLRVHLQISIEDIEERKTPFIIYNILNKNNE